MNPTPGDAYVNQLLTNVSVAYYNNETNFVADQIFPSVPVDIQGGTYFTFDRADFNRDEMEKRAPATETKGGGFRVATDTYYAHVWGFHKDIDDQVRANSRIGDLDTSATNYVTRKAKIRKEKLFVSTYMQTGVWTGDYAGVAGSPGANQVKQWNDAASTPVDDINIAKASMLLTTGFEPNILAIGYQVFQKLQNHPQVIDRVKYTQNIGANQTVKVNELALAYLFGVDKLVVMKAIENTAKEGLAESNAFIGGKKALLVYAAPAPGLQTPTAGYTFSWTGYLGASDEGIRIKRFRMENIASDRVEIEAAFDMKKVSADLGFYFDSIIA